MLVDKLVDKIRHLSEKIDKNGCSKKVENYLKDIFNLIDEQFKALHKNEIADLVKKRYFLVKKIENESFDKKELEVLSEVKIFLDTINDFSAVILVRENHLKITH